MTNAGVLTPEITQTIFKHLVQSFGADTADFIEKNPVVFGSLLKEAFTQELIKKNTLKDVFSKFSPQKGGIFGGLFGRGGLFSYLKQSLFKKSSTGLTAGVPLGKDLGPAQTDPITPSTPPTPNDEDKEPKQKEFLKGIGTTEPIPMLFAGFSDTGSQQITDIFSSLFKTLIKDLLKGLKGVIPEPEEDYGEGLIPTLMDSFIEPLLMAIPFLGPLLKRFVPGMRGRAASRSSLGQGRKGAAARRRSRSQGRGASAYTARTGRPSVKPSVPVNQVQGSGGAAARGASRTGTAAARSTGKGLFRGASRGLSRALPGLGTALTVGFLASDLSNVAEQEAKGEITQKEAYEGKGRAWGGAGGALGGAAAGAAIGAMFGGVGAIPGAVIGGILGSMGGEAAGGAIGSSLAPQEEPPITPTPDTSKLDIPEPKDYTNSLNEISNNTGKTFDKLSRLSDAIFALANTYKTQGPGQAANNFFINGQQQKEVASASQVAENNVDAIGRIRLQFAV